MKDALLTEKTIRIGAKFESREHAIRACGSLLLMADCIHASYIDAMVERDRASTVYVGNGVAVPHGTKESVKYIKKTGLALVQVPDGIDFGNGQIARLLVAVAAKGDEHIDLLTEIAQICVDDDELAKLLNATKASEVLSVLSIGKNG
ncbi:MAG: PTS sugar transporter subunit IIA [Spirochaetes bacterium]|nr:PTS sugar transporter subunit IIA [Spirochaetota bacterium]MBU0955174.1 PTS sugar transporter subunit IIA [Spirochaetota bacterium]